MADVWQTIEQAAVTLGLSVRTVNRHITAGKLQSRLFEGRREVLVALPEERPRAERAPFAAASAVGGQPARPPFASGSMEEGNGTSSWVDGSTMTATAADGSSDGVSREPRDAFRQNMSADGATDRPLDAQTMLALADSIDDKASLAVAAYQTLAHSAETQVHSLRRVAFGAWAAVGVMAAGVIVAVGWATHRLTSAEVNADNLTKEVSKQTSVMERLAQERDAVGQELQRMQIEAAEMKGRLANLSEQAGQYRAAAELAAFAVRQLQDARPATLPSTAPSTAPSVSPAVPPANAATQPSAAHAVAVGSPTRGAEAGSPGSSPALQSASTRPVVPPTSRPVIPRAQFAPNPDQAFGPR